MNKTYVTNESYYAAMKEKIAERYNVELTEHMHKSFSDFYVSKSITFAGDSFSIERILRDLYRSRPAKVNSIIMPSIDKVIFNEPATIILWDDGSKTVVKCTDGEEYDPAIGFAMAYVKKACGNTGRIFRACQKDYDKQMAKREEHDK